MIPLADDAARRTALAVHDRSLLVEAGAGSGKTAVLAGRIALMLAEGILPGNIAAVTFTELAASELLMRVSRFATDLNQGHIPLELQVALPNGLSDEQKANLAAAIGMMDEITCTTIHGFCQQLIKPYPVAADIDPGAGIMDRDQSDMAFNEQADAWLKGALDEDHGGLLAELVMRASEETLTLIRAILKNLRSYRDLHVERAGDLESRLRLFCQDAREFAAFVEGCGLWEQDTADMAEAFTKLAAALDGEMGDTAMRVVFAEIDSVLVTTAGDFRKFRKKGKWQAAAKAGGQSKADAERLFEQASEHYEHCCASWTALSETAASHLLDALLEEVRPAVTAYRDHKRSTAQLDFDDLIYSARDLLRDHEDIRRALAERYSHLLVDEFQDTDPLQTEIIWRLCGDPIGQPDEAAWSEFRIRPGALFLVGDPKQAIYRFRGADVEAYVRARRALLQQDPDSLLRISTNFRSRAPILDYVNSRFEVPLSEEQGQPGFTKLDPFHAAPDARNCVAAIDIQVEGVDGKITVEMYRDAEADAIAALCEKLIGSEIDMSSGTRRCRPGDIALLAPSGKDLWRYEEALERLGIPVATQAGKGLYRRQEIQDLIALTRVLADSRDRLALGALLRGPLVGLSEEELLDIVWELGEADADERGVPKLELWLETKHISNEYARNILGKLQSLSRLAQATTPHDLLCQAIDALRVRPIVGQRHQGQAERVLANVDLFLTMSRAYSLRGLRAFAEAMTAAWHDEFRAPEGRPDAQEESVALFTMHAAKGLEWPIVIPVNTMTRIMAAERDIADRTSGRVFLPVFGADPEGYADARSAERAELNRERVRLWYVTTTRARELLVLPRIQAAATSNQWNGVLELGMESLPGLDSGELTGGGLEAEVEAENRQSHEVFVEEARRIVDAKREIRWTPPSRKEQDAETSSRVEGWDLVFSEGEEDGGLGLAAEMEVRGGRERGTILHKLFEEVLNGEVQGDEEALVERAALLVRQLGKEVVQDASQGLSPKEMAGCVLRTLALPEVRELTPRLLSEFSVFGSREVDGGEEASAGVADAIALGADGRPEVVIDWKTDVRPSARTLDHYRAQLKMYLRLTRAEKGLIVLVTSGRVIELQAAHT